MATVLLSGSTTQAGQSLALLELTAQHRAQTLRSEQGEGMHSLTVISCICTGIPGRL